MNRMWLNGLKVSKVEKSAIAFLYSLRRNCLRRWRKIDNRRKMREV